MGEGAKMGVEYCGNWAGVACLSTPLYVDTYLYPLSTAGGVVGIYIASYLDYDGPTLIQLTYIFNKVIYLQLGSLTPYGIMSWTCWKLV